MAQNNGTWTVNLPLSLVAINYVLRNKIIALHSAYNVGDAQFYLQCINLEVTSGGSDNPSGMVGIQLYKSSDPGIHYNIYNDGPDTAYIILGPPLWIH